MVIIQRCEPVISASFPSLIPFWIKIKGLPLHFWHDDMICRIGQELGTLDNQELTKTTARFRVLVDRLKPLVKESIVEFDSGEESPITLEYEKLEMHCSFCFSLLHARKKCPLRLEEKAHEPLTSHRGVSEGRNEHLTTRSSYVALPDRAPTKAPSAPDNSKASWNGNPDQERPHIYGSPSYARRRENLNRTSQNGRDLFLQRSLGQWRPKQVTISETAPKPPHVQAGPPSHELTVVAQVQQPSGDVRAVTREAVMEDSHEVTRQYLSCADPVEAAVRKHRRQQQFNPPPPPPGLCKVSLAKVTQLHSPLCRTSHLMSSCLPTRRLFSVLSREKRKVRVWSPAPATMLILLTTPHSEDFQNRVSRRVSRTSSRRSPRENPNILRGASSKKGSFLNSKTPQRQELAHLPYIKPKCRKDQFQLPELELLWVGESHNSPAVAKDAKEE
ncbi:hypothetical protein YC2023_062187 [Brassica napus]